MNDDYTIGKLMQVMLLVAVREASHIWTPGNPPDEASEKEADDYCLRFVRTDQAELPSKKVASALVPRLRAARLFASSVENSYDQQARLGDRAASKEAILTAVLVTQWREVWKPLWLAGRID